MLIDMVGLVFACLLFPLPLCFFRFLPSNHLSGGTSVTSSQVPSEAGDPHLACEHPLSRGSEHQPHNPEKFSSGSFVGITEGKKAFALDCCLKGAISLIQ